MYFKNGLDKIYVTFLDIQFLSSKQKNTFRQK